MLNLYMEYKMFYYMRNNSNTPFLFRLFFAIILILISTIPIFLPIFPGSLFLWIFILVLWLIWIVPSSKVKNVIKIRKSVIYLFSNLHKKHTIWHKIYDIKKQVKNILVVKKIKREEKIIKKHKQKLLKYKNKIK